MKVNIRDIIIGDGNPLVLIAGPCVVESEKMIMDTASQIHKITQDLDIPYIFKSSFRKANRTSVNSFSGIGDSEAIKILGKVSTELNLPVLTDIHTSDDIEKVGNVADIIQIPAFLSRQTELLIEAGKSRKCVNVKKGQFMAPEDIKHAAEKISSTGNTNILLTERGTSFGYHNLVVDMRSFVIMKETGYPVVMDATHSVQLPSKDNISGGEPRFIMPLAKAAVAVGIDALFLEVHPNPAEAKSDAASQLSLKDLRNLLQTVKEIDRVTKTSSVK